MKNIGFKNFRSLKNINNVELKDLTIFVGKNSCGKSTFLRSFPLFKQTASTDRSIPILWYSESLVDFGDYSTAKSLSAKDDENISFIFENTIKKENLDYPLRNQVNGDLSYSLELSIIQKEINQELIEYVDFIDIKINNNLYLIKFNKNLKVESISINDLSFKIDVPYILRGKILPSFFLRELFSNEKMLDSILNKIKTIMIKNNLHFSSSIAHSLDIFFFSTSSNIEKNIFFEQINKIIKKPNLLNDENGELIFSEFTLLSFNDIYYNISEDINSFFEKSHYIAPIRATPQRYYRLQGLSVENVDSTGRNLSLFLKSLTPNKLDSLKKWINELFSFSIEIENTKGHVSINILDGDQKINLTDTGFGYSQLLPIIVQIWYSNFNRFTYRNTPTTFVIEQPELHLHPALQTKLIDAFIHIITKFNSNTTNSKVKFIIETHSETFINRIGENIWKSKISKDDVVVYRFEKNNFETEIIESTFNEEGTLSKWPIGFFAAEESDDLWYSF